MIVIRTSTLSGITRAKEFDITEDQYDAWRKGALIQNVMPHLSDDEREFIMTGITKDEWDEIGAEIEEAEEYLGYM